jgi:hypothetical protein
MNDKKVSRRAFLSVISAAIALPRPGRAAIRHPDPRPGITAEKVLTREQLKGLSKSVIEIFDKVREIPDIADGIGCNCGCSVMPTYRSLLTCYYETGMARGCQICQGEAKIVYRRHKEGQTLEQIRRAIDACFG